VVAERTPSATQTRRESAAAQEIARIAATEGWQAAAHDYMRQRSNAAYRLAVDEYRAQLCALLPLDSKSRVLHLRCGWGPIALGIASSPAWWRRSTIGRRKRVFLGRGGPVRAQTPCNSCARA